jgi:hypothetical protein
VLVSAEREIAMTTGESAAENRGLARIPFSIEAEGHIKSLALWLSILGWLNIVAAVFNLIGVLSSVRNSGQFVNFLISLLLGIWARQAASAFRAVATTDTADQAYLVQGFTKLRAIFLLQGIMIIVGLAFVAAVGLFLLFWGLSTRH